MRKEPLQAWKCAESVKYGKEKINAQGRKVGCNCQSVHERFLQTNFLAVLDAVIENKALVVEELKKSVHHAIDTSPDKSAEIEAIGSDMEKITNRKSKLLDLYTDGAISRAAFDKANDQYNKQLLALNKQFTVLKLDNKLVEDLTQKLVNVEKTIETIVRLKEYSDSVCAELLNKVVVDGREKLSFYMTSGENKDPVFFKAAPLITPCAQL